jgi:hypothetical protein
MSSYRAIVLAAILAISPLNRAVIALVDDDVKFGINGEGYVSKWLILAPIPLEVGQDGAAGLAKQQVKDEANLIPRPGQKIALGDKEYAWKAAKANDGVLDFNEILGQETENSVAYAVSNLLLDEDKNGVTLKVGSDDQVRVYLNGKQIHSNDEARPLEKDEDTVEGLSLKKGRNVLVMKVVNEGSDWGASARFFDKDGGPIKGMKATIESEDDANAGIDGEGYISKWLILAPIPLEDGQDGAAGLAKQQINDEASLNPKLGDKIELAGKECVWKAARAEDGVLDFNEILGQETENSVAYAVSVIILEDDKSGVTLKVGSDDQVRVYLNGKQIHSNDEARPLEKDQDTIEGLSLKKGRNVLVMKVVNEGSDWGASARFVDKDGAPIKGIKATIEPE